MAKYLKARISYDRLQRVESWPIPEEALREAVLNAVSHKDYGSGAPIQISVYRRDRLMAWNPGQLPADWTVQTLTQKHASLPANPDVANAFFRAGMVESWGRGIERIMSSCAAASVPTPELRYEQTGLWITFPFAPSDDAKTPVKRRVETQTPVETPVETQTRVEMPVKTPVETQTRVETPVKTRVETQTPVETPVETQTRVETPDRILELLGANPEMTLGEVANAINRSLTAVERASAKLVKERRLRHVGPRKGGHWEVLQ